MNAVRSVDKKQKILDQLHSFSIEADRIILNVRDGFDFDLAKVFLFISLKDQSHRYHVDTFSRLLKCSGVTSHIIALPQSCDLAMTRNLRELSCFFLTNPNLSTSAKVSATVKRR